MTEQIEINELLRLYRNYIAEAHPIIQNEVYWQTPKFEMIIDHLADRLRFLKKYNLLNFVDPDLGNLDTLTELAKQKEEENRNIQIKAALDGKTVVIDDSPKFSNQFDAQASDIKISEVLNEFAKTKVSSNRDKTASKMYDHIRFLIETVGDVSIAKFNQTMLREYLAALRDRKRTYQGNRISIHYKTKNEHISSCERLFDFAIARYCENAKNYFSGEQIRFKGTKRENRKGVGFTSDELLKIFSDDIFTLGKFRYPYQYWAPLIALYSGSRANEIAQLRVSDIVKVDGIYCFSHNLNTADKMIKTDIPRFVPIHPKLIELNLIDFAKLFDDKKYQWEEGENSHRLFKGLSLDKRRGGYQKNLSRWFNGTYDAKKNINTGFKHQLGIIFKAGEKKDFHSFRHTLATALKNAGVQKEISYDITGHIAKEDAGSVYRDTASIEVMYEAICKLDFGSALDNVMPFFKLNGEKKCRNKVLKSPKNAS